MSRKKAALTCLKPLVSVLDTSIAKEPPKRPVGFYTSPHWRVWMASLAP